MKLRRNYEILSKEIRKNDGNNSKNYENWINNGILIVKAIQMGVIWR